MVSRHKNMILSCVTLAVIVMSADKGWFPLN